MEKSTTRNLETFDWLSSLRGVKVVVGMSGGIDSTISAILLKEYGCDVVGIILKMWEYEAGNGKETGCCSINSIMEARFWGHRFGFPTYVVDIKELFSRKIIDYFVREYLDGRTPNPCVMCNLYVKWAVLLEYADRLGFDLVATGHYARIGSANGRFFVKKGVDSIKDQSYMLWPLTQRMLERTVFPLGGVTKTQVRELAREMGLEALAQKRESYEICFIQGGDYRDFIKRRGIKEKEGVIKDWQGRIVGKHPGYWNFTIGQRRGLPVALGYPAYVIEINKDRNEIVVGPRHMLAKREVTSSWFNLMKYDKIDEGLNVEIKVRYIQEEVPAILYQKDGALVALVKDGVEGVTPGQSMVAYEGEDLVAGGIID